MENIQKGNQLIAEFMEFSHSHEYYDWDGKHEVKYNTSWDWLMPVVEKIESLGYEVSMQPHQCQVFKDNEFIIDADFKTTRLENTWDGVVAFIQWYNQQSKELEIKL